MILQRLNIICYTICIVSIVAGVILALLMIWGNIDNDVAWKGVLTIGVLLFAAMVTLSINKMMESRSVK